MSNYLCTDLCTSLTLAIRLREILTHYQEYKISFINWNSAISTPVRYLGSVSKNADHRISYTVYFSCINFNSEDDIRNTETTHFQHLSEAY